jgi:hypothetical protein
MFAKQSRCIRFITLIVPLFLVFMGMRVPDFSHPHKPKPMRRAVLDKTQVKTVFQSVVKIEVAPFLTTPHTFALLATEDYLPEVHPIYSPVPLLLLRPFPPRAPPVSHPLA